ncbi:MAG: hypothetical protein ACOCTT_00350 [archaeon]
MKRIQKAIAIGGAAITLFGLGALPAAASEVETHGEHLDLIEEMKENVGNVEVVTGSGGAHIEDGRQAARIASVLVNQNYMPAAQDDFEIDADIEIDENETYATILKTEETSLRETGFEISDSQYTIEQSNSTGGDDFQVEEGASTTLKHAQIPEVLSSQTIEVDVEGDDKKFTLEEELEIPEVTANYDESDEDPDDHGLFLDVDGDIKWNFNFDARGQGLPTNSSKYEEGMPKFEMLGTDFVLSKSALDEGEIAFWEAAEEGTVNAGESLEMDGFTVTVLDVTEDPNEAYIEVEYEGETKREFVEEDTGEEIEIGGETITVYANDVWFLSGGETGVADLLLGTSTLDLEEDGDPFPMDERWELDGYETSDSDVGVGDDRLETVTLTYGNSDAEDWLEVGEFDGNAPFEEEGGLPVDTPVTGPVTEHFELEFLGMGESSPTHTTDVEIDMNGGDIVNVEYFDRAGVLNIFDPSKPKDANLTTEGSAWDGTEDALILEEDQYTIIDNKVVYLESVDEDDGDYEIEFRVNSDDGTSLVEIVAEGDSFDSGSGNDPADGTPVTFSLDQGGDGLEFDANVDEDTEEVYINEADIDGNGEGNFIVETGDKILFDNEGLIDFANDADVEDHWDDGDVSSVYVEDGAGAGAGTYAVYDDNMDNEGLRIGEDWNESDYVNYAQDEVETSDKYHILGTGLEIMDTSKGTATITLPDKQRHALTRIGAGTEDTEEGTPVGDEVEVGIGDAFNGWEVTDIDVPYELSEAVVENVEDFYTAKSELTDPENMIVADDESVRDYRIVVGGPHVNALAEDMEAAEDLQETGDAVIAVEGDDLLVAGWLAEDTKNAANDLIEYLKE